MSDPDASVAGLEPEQHGRTTATEVLDAATGVAIIGGALLTPFLRRRRSRWGLSAAEAVARFPGDELVPRPRWSWTHAVEVDASAAAAWPWLAQLGADRGGFYSYEGLENLAGCRLENAETIHPEWELRVGDRLVVHPDMPGLPIVAAEPGSYFVAHAAAHEEARAQGEPWVAASWLLLVEPLGVHRCRVVSRYRVATSADARTRLAFGATLVEPMGFAMDRRMLLGIKDRAERRALAS